MTELMSPKQEEVVKAENVVKESQDVGRLSSFMLQPEPTIDVAAAAT